MKSLLLLSMLLSVQFVIGQSLVCDIPATSASQSINQLNIQWKLDFKDILCFQNNQLVLNDFFLNSSIPSFIDNTYPSEPIKAYPNPFTDQLKLDMGKEGSSPNSLMIFDITGKCVLEQDIQLSDQWIQLKNLPPGTYILQLSSHHLLPQIIKIIKQ